MDKSRIAEWMLSLVLPPDRSASTVGDWMEDAAERGNVWFWSCVFRTVLLSVWNDFSDSPAFMVKLAFRAFLLEIGIMIGSLFAIFLATLVAVIIFVPVGFVAEYLARQLNWHPSWPIHPSGQIGAAISFVIGLAFAGRVQFEVGKWVARRAPGREVAAAISAWAMPRIFLLLPQLVAMHFWGAEIQRFIAEHPVDSSVGMWPYIPGEIFFVAGVLWARRKSLRTVAQ